MPSVAFVSLGKSLTQVVREIGQLRNSPLNMQPPNRAAALGNPVHVSGRGATKADLDNLEQEFRQSLYQLQVESAAQMRQIQTHLSDLALATLDKINEVLGRINALAEIEKELATAIGQQFVAGEAAQLVAGLSAP